MPAFLDRLNTRFKSVEPTIPVHLDLSRSTRIMFFWAIFALCLAPGPQYFFSICLCVWFVATKGWREFDPEDKQIIRLLTKGLTVAVTCSVVAGLLAWRASPDLSLSHCLYQLFHLNAKSALRGMIIVTAFLAAFHRGLTVASLRRGLIFLLSLNIIYMIIQMFTGIDWISGFTATIPQNRFAYGLYRPSGFTAHPLSLGYNSFLLASASLFGAWPLGQKINWRGPWTQIFLASSLTLILSQTRWPILLLALLVAIRFGSAILLQVGWKTKLKSALVLLLILTASLLTTRGRFIEAFSDQRPLAERIPRLVFWQVHSKMFLDQPIWGVGYANRKSARMEYYDKSGYTNLERKYAAHNIYLQTLADSGLVGFGGLIAFLAMHYSVGRRFLRRRDPRLLWFLAGVLLLGLMQNTLQDSEFVYAYWIIMALLLGEGLRLQNKRTNGHEVTNLESQESSQGLREDVPREYEYSHQS